MTRAGDAAGYGIGRCRKEWEAGRANGALISTTERNTSGRTSAHHAATGEPKSWPITAATERWPSAADEPKRIPHKVQHAERVEIAVVIPSQPVVRP